MTVPASTLDRAFPANIELGDGQIILGQSFYRLQIRGAAESATQLIAGIDAALSNIIEATLCLPDTLDPTLVKKGLLCASVESMPVKKRELWFWLCR